MLAYWTVPGPVNEYITNYTDYFPSKSSRNLNKTLRCHSNSSAAQRRTNWNRLMEFYSKLICINNKTICYVPVSAGSGPLFCINCRTTLFINVFCVNYRNYLRLQEYTQIILAPHCKIYISGNVFALGSLRNIWLDCVQHFR